MFDTRRPFTVFALAFALLISSLVAEAAEVFPGRIRNPDGAQANAAIAYNSLQDYYLLGYGGGGVAFVGKLSTDGLFSGELAISPQVSASSMELAYNPVRNEFLYVWRNSSPNTIRARYLDGDGNPIGNEIAVSNGRKPQLDFDPVNQRYLLTFGQPGGNVRYRVFDGDSTNPNPILFQGTIASGNAIADRVQFGDVAGKFMVAYIRTQSSDNIYGKFVTTNAGDVNITSEFPIDNSSGTEQSPTLGYTSKENRWICAYQNWPGGNVLPNVRVALINPNKDITRRFNVIATTAWEIPNGVFYSPTTETTVFTWRHSQGVIEDSRAREWEVSDTGASPVGSVIILSTDNAAVTAGAARTDPVDPQVTILWRIGNGGDGVHAGILHVDPPPPDLTAPDPVNDLAGQTGGPDLLIADPIVFDVSNEQGAHPGEDSVDDDLASYWGTPAVSGLQDEWIIWDLQAQKNLNSVVFWARSSGDFFPLNYDVDVSLNGVDFDTVASIAGAVVAPGASIQHDFAPVSAQFVRLNVTLPRQTSGGNYKVQLAEAAFFEAQNTPGLITATWTATGDDGNVGAAKIYHMKWSEMPINEGNFDDADDVSGLGLPQFAGNPETVTIMGLPDETEVYIALKVEDENMNVSDINTPAADAIDTPGIPPAPVANLQVSYPGGAMADLTWQATGDDGLIGNLPDDPPGGTYDLRYASFPITDANFNDATPISGGGPVPTPGNVGFVENYTATDLPAESTVYFGIKVLDELGNTSPTDISPTEPMVTTSDFSFPSAILDLREAVGGAAVEIAGVDASDASAETGTKPKENATDDNPSTFWKTPAVAPREEFITIDTGDEHNISKVKLLSRDGDGSFFPETVEIQLSNNPTSGFVTVDTFPGLSDAAGTLHELELTTPQSAQYVRVLVTNARTNSNGLIKVEIAEIDICESPIVLGSVNLLWTAAGDNGPVGQAFSYDLRWSEMAINAGNWDDPAVHPFALPTPKEGGMDEMATVTGLPDETMIYFAMTTDDEVMNTSLLSNVATAFTPGIAPEPIDDFQVTGFTGTTADLQWTARADVGPLGRASTYDMRYSTSPITPANFHMAAPVTPAPPVPANDGVQQMHHVTGIDDSSSIWFAVRAVDAATNASPMHTNGDVMIITPDVTPPGTVMDLSGVAGVPTLSLVTAPASDTSGEASTGKAKELATDGLDETYWGTPARPPQNEFITVDTGATRTIAEVRLRSPDQTKFFPIDIDVQLSNSPMSGFNTVDSFFGFPITKSTWHTLDITDTPGRYVRILATNARTNAAGNIKVEMSEIQVFEAAPAGTLTINLTSPGDDPGVGFPTLYDLRFDTSDITNNTEFNNATEVTTEPTVNLAIAGANESFVIQAPQEGVPLYFALKASDEASPANVSELSNSFMFTPAIVPPSAVSDLTVTRVTSLSVHLSFTATGDDGLTGLAESYTVKRSTTPITEGSFNGATTVTSGVPDPADPGTMQTIDVTGLNPSTPYYFAMKVNDEITSSGISNLPPVATTDPVDVIAPAAVTDLRGGPPVTLALLDNALVSDASSESKPRERATDGDLTTHWASVNKATDGDEWITVDTEALRLIGRVRLRSPSGTVYFPEDVEIQVSENPTSDFSTIGQAVGFPATKSTWHTIDFTPAMGRYVRINITKLRFNNTFRGHIAEIEVYEATFTAGDVVLSWNATGDDGLVGQATEYDLRWSTVNGALEANFLGQPSLATDPAGPPGTVETTDPIQGLPAGTLYFAIKVRDEVTNQFSAISNVLVVDNP